MKLAQVPAVVVMTVPAPAQLASVSDDREPKVFNARCLRRLQALNETMRRLRGLGVESAGIIHLQGLRPSIQVDAKARSILIEAGKGYSSVRVEEGARLCRVTLDECDVTWYEVEAQ